MSDVSAILTGHREGMLAGASLRSLVDAVAHARAEGLVVEVMVVLDKADDPTRTALGVASDLGARVREVSYGDHGLVRNDAVQHADGDYVAFLDADDLWSENWLVEAHRLCATAPGEVIAHPELNWFFDQQHNLYFLPDQTDPEFDLAFLRVQNCWDALCMAPLSAYAEVPHSRRALGEGYAYDDWHWNLETLLAGYTHRVAPDTIIFKRRRRSSQFTAARDAGVMTRTTRFHRYAWWFERDEAAHG